MIAFCYYLGTKKIKTMNIEETAICYYLGTKKDKDNEDRRDKTEKKNRNKIVFGNDVQDKIIISISCLVIVDKTK